MECTDPATVKKFIGTLAKTKTNFKEKARPTACKRKEQNLHLVTLLRNEFLQRCISKIFPKMSVL